MCNSPGMHVIELALPLDAHDALCRHNRIGRMDVVVAATAIWPKPLPFRLGRYAHAPEGKRLARQLGNMDTPETTERYSQIKPKLTLEIEIYATSSCSPRSGLIAARCTLGGWGWGMGGGAGIDFIGFNVLDSMRNRISQFLTPSMKAHDVSFIHHPKKGKLRHGPFVLDTWDKALLVAKRIRMTIGQTRHSLPHSKTIFRITDQLDKAMFCHDRQLNERYVTALTTAALLGEKMKAAGVPDGVYNVVHGFGGNSAGAFLTEHRMWMHSLSPVKLELAKPS